MNKTSNDFARRLQTRLPALLLGLAAASSIACTPVEYEDHWMDHPSTRDVALDDPSYLVSTRISAPSEEERETPVIVAVHGFGSATGEWRDFQVYAEERGVLVSNVLLGGHGRSIDAWLETDQVDWAGPILDEYSALVDQGYRRVSLALLSTAVPLTLMHMMEGAYDELPSPEHVFLISPFIVSKDKRLYIAPVIGPVLNNVPANMNDWEHERFYTNRPHQVFLPLMELLNTVDDTLDMSGIALPPGTGATIVYAEREETIDEEGITKLEANLDVDGPFETIRLDSDWHSFIRASGRPRTADEAFETRDDDTPRVWTDEDDAVMTSSFDLMLEKVGAAR